jgi:hypothetical protein
VNRKVLGIAVILMVAAILATPVMAIGPEEAVEENPNLMQLPYGIGLYPPLGTRQAMNNEWVSETVTFTGLPEHDLWMDAVRYNIGNAIVVPNTPPVAYQVYQMNNEDKWLYLSPDVFAIMMVVWGFPPEYVPFALALHPQGIYYKWNFVGQ